MHPTDPVNRLMTLPVMTVDINDPAGEVLRLFAGYPVHHLPVLDQDKVMGMLSSADARTLELLMPKGVQSPVDYLNQRMKVRRLVRRPVLTVTPHQSVETAARMMVKHGVHALVVVNAQEKLLGIITTTDIMHAALGVYENHPTLQISAAPGTEVQPIRLHGEQLEQVTVAAAARAGPDDDPEFAHRELVQMRARVALLEQVRNIASRFVQAGQDQQLHSDLLKALHAVNRAEEQGSA